MTERTELISCPAMKNTTTKIACATKKIAVVTPEQRPKKENQSKMLNQEDCENIKNQIRIDVLPTFSCKQLLSSMIRRRMGLDNGSFELIDHQIFSIDCKKTIQLLCKFKHFLNNNNNNNEEENKVELFNNKCYDYKCLECEESWTTSNDNISNIVSHVLSKWSNNFFDETHSPKKHIGKLFTQHQVIMKWKIIQKSSDVKKKMITLGTIIRCRKCKLYFPGSLEKEGNEFALLVEHSEVCHSNVVNEWNHHQRLAIKSLR